MSAAPAWYERLNTIDSTFVYLESPAAHMHVGGIFVYEGQAPSYREFSDFIASCLPRIPRYRQRLARVPLGLGRPVWVDDDRFDLSHHVRHGTVPPPGGDAGLKARAGCVFSQPLDLRRPAWELELVDGLGPDRFAILTKTHHCLVDGVGGIDLVAAMTDSEPVREVPPPSPWTPRPAPSPARLLVSTLLEDVTRPFSLLRGALRAGTEGRRMLRDLWEGTWPLLRLGMSGRAPASSLNAPVSPHRLYEMVSLDMSALKRIRASLGGTLNDVLLAVVAGATRRLLESRGEPLRDDFRVFVPVNVRPPEARGDMGNQVAAVYCPLPLHEPDPAARVRRISASMKAVKDGKQAVGTHTLMHLAELTLPAIAAGLSNLEVAYCRFNFVVSNIPGPQVPRYLLGRRLRAFYPLIPLSSRQALSIGMWSYCGAVGFGILADADRVHDVGLLARAIPEALEELLAAARAGPVVELAAATAPRDGAPLVAPPPPAAVATTAH